MAEEGGMYSLHGVSQVYKRVNEPNIAANSYPDWGFSFFSLSPDKCQYNATN